MNIQIHISLTIYTSKFQQRFYFHQIHKESKPIMEVITFKVCACTYIPYVNKRKCQKISSKLKITRLAHSTAHS